LFHATAAASQFTPARALSLSPAYCFSRSLRTKRVGGSVRVASAAEKSLFVLRHKRRPAFSSMRTPHYSSASTHHRLCLSLFRGRSFSSDIRVRREAPPTRGVFPASTHSRSRFPSANALLLFESRKSRIAASAPRIQILSLITTGAKRLPLAVPLPRVPYSPSRLGSETHSCNHRCRSAVAVVRATPLLFFYAGISLRRPNLRGAARQCSSYPSNFQQESKSDGPLRGQRNFRIGPAGNLLNC